MACLRIEEAITRDIGIPRTIEFMLLESPKIANAQPKLGPWPWLLSLILTKTKCLHGGHGKADICRARPALEMPYAVLIELDHEPHCALGKIRSRKSRGSLRCPLTLGIWIKEQVLREALLWCDR